jgi:2-polyprenyl-6-methoxyphenol hydroxylase-like FAD-dependent oxidoreductase
MHTEPKSRRERAIVIGGSMAGLLAARVLANYFQSVLIIDRDDLSNGGEQRRGVPQGRHAHALLAAGGATIEQLIPGISRQLIEAGAIEADTVGDGTWFFEGGGFRKAASGVSGVLSSRPLLESTIRKRVRSLPNIEIVDGQLCERSDRIRGQQSRTRSSA